MIQNMTQKSAYHAKWLVVYQAATQASRDQWTCYQSTSTPTHFDPCHPRLHPSILKVILYVLKKMRQYILWENEYISK